MHIVLKSRTIGLYVIIIYVHYNVGYMQVVSYSLYTHKINFVDEFAWLITYEHMAYALCFRYYQSLLILSIGFGTTTKCRPIHALIVHCMVYIYMH